MRSQSVTPDTILLLSHDDYDIYFYNRNISKNIPAHLSLIIIVLVLTF